jgi:sterol desaturase/sphingolipid hydroxylase (fatty acid hydroxylase superfamily)
MNASAAAVIIPTSTVDAMLICVNVTLRAVASFILSWWDWVINTPSAHRVHHASNPEYVDKNFGGVLMIWDHLFGTYRAELPNVKIRFGLSHPRSSPDNPFVIAYEELWRMLRDIVSVRGWRERLRSVLGPPR